MVGNGADGVGDGEAVPPPPPPSPPPPCDGVEVGGKAEEVGAAVTVGRGGGNVGLGATASE